MSAVVWVLPPLLNVYKNLGIYKDDCNSIRKNADNIVILTLDSTGQSANTMNAEFRDSLDVVTQKLKAETELSGVIFRSAKNFLCWGDLDELIQVQPENATDFSIWLRS